jgi:hypothetical protein
MLVLLFLFAMIQKKKKETEFLLAAVLFKTEFLVELDIGLLFSEGKRHSEQD